MQDIKERPAYVTFEVREVEDRDASIAAGHYVGKDVIYAIITPPGSRDKIERVADEWMAQNKDAVKEDRLPREWERAYADIYKDFKEGRETPVDGTPILTWPPLSPSQQKSILAANIRTVEHLADANEAALNTIGMGGRALKQKAVEWLAQAGGTGKNAEEVIALRTELEASKASQEVMAQQMKDMAAQLKVLQNAKG